MGGEPSVTSPGRSRLTARARSPALVLPWPGARRSQQILAHKEPNRISERVWMFGSVIPKFTFE